MSLKELVMGDDIMYSIVAIKYPLLYSTLPCLTRLQKRDVRKSL